MQIFIIGSVLETAKSLDKKRFHRQISEARLVLDSIKGKKQWKGPLVEMYRNHVMWLDAYIKCFESYRDGREDIARNLNFVCDILKPPFFRQEYFDNMKRRLYTKDKVTYKIWEDLGESHTNMYWDVKGDCWMYKEQKDS